MTPPSSSPLPAGTWHKPAISAKNLARLRREALLAGEEWPYDKPAAEVKRRKPKGHKHDREKPLRCVQPCFICNSAHSWHLPANWRDWFQHPAAPVELHRPRPGVRLCRLPSPQPDWWCVLPDTPTCSARCREAAIQKKLAEADKRIAEYRVGGCGRSASAPAGWHAGHAGSTSMSPVAVDWERSTSACCKCCASWHAACLCRLPRLPCGPTPPCGAEVPALPSSLLQAAQHAPMREASLMDRILLTPKQIRQKAKGG